jgi:hypothetical protein
MKKLFLLMIILIALIVIVLCVILFQKNNRQVIFMPKKDVKVTQNPYMGFAPPADDSNYTQTHSLVYANFTWRDLEPQNGQYNFAEIEKKINLEEWKKKNIKLVFRVVLDTPGAEKHMDIPDWLYKEINHDGTWYDHAWGKGFSPNYSNRTLIAEHEKLIQALAARYNNDPEIAFIEMGTIGHWGEFHTLQQDGIYIPFPKLPIVETYVNQYIKYFNNKILLMRRPHQIALDNNMGLFNDMFGKKSDTDEFSMWIKSGYKLWLTGEKMPAMPDYWKKAPTGGEFAPTDHWEDYFSAANFPETMRQLNETHVSWLGPSAPSNYPQSGAMQKRINQLLEKMGYHFQLIKETHSKKAKPGESTKLVMDWENTGVAPFYFQWPLEISLEDKTGNIVYKEKVKTDIRKWLPGKHEENTTITLPSNLKAGDYHFCVAIIDPTTNKPGIKLEMQGERKDGRYQLGKLIIE